MACDSLWIFRGRSNLSEMSEQLQQVVHPQLQQYLVESLNSTDFVVKPLSAGDSRNNFLIEGESVGKCILHAKRGQSTDQYTASIQFQMYLQEAGAPVAKTLAAPSFLDQANCSVQLCEFIAGRHLQSFSAQTSYELGRQLAVVHQLSLEAVAENRMNQAVIEPGFDRSKRRARLLQTVRGYASYVKWRLAGKQRIPREWIFDRTTDNLDASDLPAGYTHGDLHPTNLLYDLGRDEPRLIALLDFEYVNFRPLISDLVTCVVKVVCKGATELKPAETNAVALLQGYQSIRSLTLGESKAFPCALQCRLQQMLLRRLSRWHRLSEKDVEQVLANQSCLRELVHVIAP